MRIGILTLYHNTTNYGGALQAYALCSVINNMGFECEQVDICFDASEDIYTKGLGKETFKQRVQSFVNMLYKKMKRIVHRKLLKEQKRMQKEMRNVFRDFNENVIPHSARQYDQKNICEALSEYDAFIVGSDQIWNPMWYFSPFFLSFVPADKPKIAYAASVSQDNLPADVKTIYYEHLKDFRAISVREKETIDLLEDISPIKVEHVLDPTLLLTKEEWIKISEKRIIEKSYVFCYFLGNRKDVRDAAQRFASFNNCIVVNAMHATGIYHRNDIGFGDERLSELAPKDFLSLIAHAEYVFTDSFHASVFSIIFQREFFVFERQGYKAMGKRISGLLSMFSLEERFCIEQEEILEYLFNSDTIDYTQSSEKFHDLKKKSLDFLKSSLV